MDTSPERSAALPLDDGEWFRAAALSEIEEGAPLDAVVNGVDLLLVRLGEEVYATSNICTHQYARLSDGYLDDDIIECPLHGACFNVRTGECLGPTADEDLRKFAVEIREGDVFVRLRA